MYFRPALRSARSARRQRRGWAMALCALLVLGIGCYPGPSIEQAKRASRAARAAWIQPTATVRRQGRSPPRSDRRAD